MIIITAKQDGFRRCGRPHSKEPTEYKDGHWTKEDLAILQAEPMLVVAVAAEGNGGGNKRPRAEEVIEAIGKCATFEELDKLTEGDDRKTVKDAAAARRAALEQGGQG